MDEAAPGDLLDTVKGIRAGRMPVAYAHHGGGRVLQVVTPACVGGSGPGLYPGPGKLPVLKLALKIQGDRPSTQENGKRRQAPGGVLREALMNEALQKIWQRKQGARECVWGGACPWFPALYRTNASGAPPSERVDMEGKIVCLDDGVKGWGTVPCKVLGMCTMWVKGEHVRWNADTRELLGDWTDRKRLCVCTSLLKAVSFMHGCGVVLRDVKETNYYIEQVGPDEWTVKLLDFAGVFVDVETVSSLLGEDIEEAWQDIQRKYLHKTDMPRQVGGAGERKCEGDVLQ